jgi:molybdopterin synthase catalytic subunit
MIRLSSSRPAAEDSAVRRGSGLGAAAEPAADRSDLISPDPLDIAVLLKDAHHPGAGAVVLFSGEVRDNNRGRAVAYLEYESYRPLAAKMIGEILREARDKWALHIAIARHRTGIVAIGETAVVVITASAHRSEAYAANRYIIDRIKHEVPIWKCEYFADGSHAWGNNCHCAEVTGDPAKHIYKDTHE